MITASIVLYKHQIIDIKETIESYSPSNERILFLIDNSPSSIDLEEYKKSNFIHYIYNDSQNLGYGKAHNIGLQKAILANSKYHIILNPDISFNPSIIKTLKVFMDMNTDASYLLPKTVYPNGELQYLCKLLPSPFISFFRRFFSKFVFFQKLNNKYELRHFDYSSIINPPCLSGCFMFLRMKTLIENNLFFDEDFFMYYEDYDIIRRIHRISRTIYYPFVTITHNHAKESYRDNHMLKIHIESAWKYFNKYGWFFDKERRRMNNQILNEIDILNNRSVNS